MLAAYSAADLRLYRIGALLNYNLQNIVPRTAQVPAEAFDIVI